MIIPRRVACIGVTASLAAASFLIAAENSKLSLPPFREVYDLVRSNLTALTEADLDRAATLGLLSQLQSRATLLTNGTEATPASAVPLVSKSTALEGAYGLLRVGRVGSGLSNEMAGALEQLRATNQLKGLILDLRFAMGQDYPAAARAADLFFKTEQPLLQWGESVARSTPKSQAVELPLIVLVNRDTEGAAEALAAAVRQAEGVLLLGSPTAGRAYLFKDVSLSNGQVLRVASGHISNGRGEKLSENGLMPDIRIAVKFEDEKAYFEDPYRVLSKPFAQATRAGTNDLSSGQSTNRPRRRLNEAELVRMQREGLDFELDPLPSNSPQTSSPVLTDPAVSRALDLLKGLSLAVKRRN